jgi:hypothetical protein
MDPILLLAILCLIAIVLGPILGAEDRPAFKWPDRKPRRMVGPPWKPR